MAEPVKEKKPRKASKSEKTYYEGIGRRKSAVARVRIYLVKKGATTIGDKAYKAGDFVVNSKPLASVFVAKSLQLLCMKPLVVTDASAQYVVSATTVGGGPNGQVEAVSHGLARALAQIPSADLKYKLRVAGLLTRDSRIRERRKVGTGGKARRVKQSPKR